VLNTEQSTYPAWSLAWKILKTFPDVLSETKTNKAGVVIYNKSLTEEDAIRRAAFD